MLKLSDNPPIRPESLASIADAEGSWWVAHTKARNEKALAWDLMARGIDYFLPLVKRITFSGGRKRYGMAPLFSSYVFFSGDEDARYSILTTNRVANVIRAPEREQFVRELCAIEQAIEHGERLDFYPTFAKGARCRITKGPLENTEGIVLQGDDVTRVVLQVSMLGVGASVEINGDLLEILD